MEISREEYEKRIEIAVYRGGSWQLNRQKGDNIDDEVKRTIKQLDKRDERITS